VIYGQSVGLQNSHNLRSLRHLGPGHQLRRNARATRPSAFSSIRELPLSAGHHPVRKQPDQTQQGARSSEAGPCILHADNEGNELRDGLFATEVRLEILVKAALTLADALELREVLDRLETKLGWQASVEAAIRSASGCQPPRAASLSGVALSQSPLIAVAGSQDVGSTTREKVAPEYSVSRPSGSDE
jgi:hypothetical protein